MLDVCLAGTGGMKPLPGRWLTCLYARSEGHSVLIDCGEGTQIALAEAGCNLKPIDLICITHVHADHVAGLLGQGIVILTEGKADGVGQTAVGLAENGQLVADGSHTRIIEDNIELVAYVGFLDLP